MRVPQVKEAPASALRAMFAGIGSLLSVTDKFRTKPSAAAPADAEAPAPEAAAPEAVAPQTTAAPEDTAAPEGTAPAEDTTPPEHTAVPAVTQVPDPVAETAAETTAAPEEAAALPLANYEELSVASLRARLRNLSAEQLTELSDYEKAHAGRADVVTMFERRIAKLAAGLTTSLPQVKLT
jgi:hypothetical protein